MFNTTFLSVAFLDITSLRMEMVETFSDLNAASFCLNNIENNFFSIKTR